MLRDEHTALPWEQDGRDIYDQYGNEVIVQCRTPNDACEALANSQFIVLAVNNHYELIESLAQMVRIFAPMHNDPEGQTVGGQACLRAQRILAKVKGK